MRRSIAIAAALIFGTLGTLLLVNYVRSAEDRALEGVEMVDVLVVEDTIPEGSDFDAVLASVRREQVPRKVAAADAVSEVTDLSGMIATVDLLPGEQVLGSRFITEADYLAALAAEGTIDVPADLIEITLALDPARAVGGQISPGDLVTVFSSFDPFKVATIEPSELEELTEEELQVILSGSSEDDGTPTDPFGPQSNLQTPNSTGIILYDVLVTSVQLEQLPQASEDETDPTVRLAPTGNLLVTLGLDPVSAERVIFTMEHGELWLGREGADVENLDTDIQTRSSIYGEEDGS